ncbi:hypothetical protein HF521_008600 [Silurus meridionalis]|uniref:Uncharacterized protein n=1 Tax=Silurus meridionalis TaxID=175797 RepID=A0A8T0AN77_SILME|nr:hypothetical protein HF521_008600 [Silurus meridionalis]
MMKSRRQQEAANTNQHKVDSQGTRTSSCVGVQDLILNVIAYLLPEEHNSYQPLGPSPQQTNSSVKPNHDIKLAMAIYDNPLGFEAFIQRSIRISQRLAACQSQEAKLAPHPTVPSIPEPEPMQIGSQWLTI